MMNMAARKIRPLNGADRQTLLDGIKSGIDYIVALKAEHDRITAGMIG